MLLLARYARSAAKITQKKKKEKKKEAGYFKITTFSFAPTFCCM